ncbi:MAG: hypothetical protein PGMFKBFP_02850 [Anaerolineales bacterium]|nr:hypothetical protein [Anaerolineales bacterium]
MTARWGGLFKRIALFQVEYTDTIDTRTPQTTLSETQTQADTNASAIQKSVKTKREKMSMVLAIRFLRHPQTRLKVK